MVGGMKTDWGNFDMGLDVVLSRPNLVMLLPFAAIARWPP